MVGNKPRISIHEISANLREVDLAFTSRVLATGNGLRIRIPRKEAKFWDIKPRKRFTSRLPSSSATVSWQNRLERTHFCGKGFSQR